MHELFLLLSMHVVRVLKAVPWSRAGFSFRQLEHILGSSCNAACNVSCASAAPSSRPSCAKAASTLSAITDHEADIQLFACDIATCSSSAVVGRASATTADPEAESGVLLPVSEMSMFISKSDSALFIAHSQEQALSDVHRL